MGNGHTWQLSLCCGRQLAGQASEIGVGGTNLVMFTASLEERWYRRLAPRTVAVIHQAFIPALPHPAPTQLLSSPKCFGKPKCWGCQCPEFVWEMYSGHWQEIPATPCFHSSSWKKQKHGHLWSSFLTVTPSISTLHCVILSTHVDMQFILPTHWVTVRSKWRHFLYKL